MIKIDSHAGDSFHNIAKKAQGIARLYDEVVEFVFNGKTIRVHAHTNLELLWRDMQTSWLLDWSIIENPVKEYDKPTLEAIDAAEKAQQERQAEQQAEWGRKDAEQKRLFNEKVGKSDILLKDSKTWDEYVEKNQDAYRKCAVDYACDWAILMQYYMANGETIEQCADRASHELGWYGITGFMYGCAVQMLSQCWIHGEELRKWHNKEYNHEGDGVVNPAILTINPN